MARHISPIRLDMVVIEAPLPSRLTTGTGRTMGEVVDRTGRMAAEAEEVDNPLSTPTLRLINRNIILMAHHRQIPMEPLRPHMEVMHLLRRHHGIHMPHRHLIRMRGMRLLHRVEEVMAGMEVVGLEEGMGGGIEAEVESGSVPQ